MGNEYKPSTMPSTYTRLDMSPTQLKAISRQSSQVLESVLEQIFKLHFKRKPSKGNIFTKVSTQKE